MRLRLNLGSNKTLREKNQIDIFSKMFENNKNKKMIKSEFSEANFSSSRNNKENINLQNINNYSLIEYNSTNKENKKPKRAIRSASLLKRKKSNKNERNKNPKIIYSIKHIHQIVSFIEKKFNSFNDLSKDNMYNTNCLSSIFNNNPLSRNVLNIKNNEEKTENNVNINHKKNNELIPYPFKRMQNKIRKYFSLSKNKMNNNGIKLPEEPIASGYNFQNKFLLKIRKINEHKFIEKRKEIYYLYRNKINRNNNSNNINNRKSIIKIDKKDKSVNTENILIRRNFNGNKKVNSLFNNQLIASLTNFSDKKFFLTTGDKKNRYKRNENNRSILVYHKNY